MLLRATIAAAAAVLAAIAASGCSQRAEPLGELPAPYPVTVAGAADGPVELAARPERVVALDPGAAELVAALGAGDQLVGAPAGVTVERPEPPAQVVSPTGRIDVDAVVALEPDLVIATAESDRVDVAQVERRTDAPLYVQPARSVEDVWRAISELGFLVGEPAEARRLLAALRRAVAETERRLEGTEPVTAFVDRGFRITISDDSLLGDLIRRAGGVSVAGDGAGLGPFPAARLRAADPDVYLVTSDSDVTLESLRRDPETRGLAAVREGRFAVLPTELVLRAGPRVAEALEAVALALHPDAFR